MKKTQTSESLEQPAEDQPYVSPDVAAAQAGEQVSFTVDIVDIASTEE